MNELKQQRIWFCWRYETRKSEKTKVPKSATGTATGTSDDYKSTWVTYDEAVAGAKAHGMDGVGFKIPEEYFFLDMDHYELSDPYVQLMLERFDSYAERSVSGGGIHIYGKCDPARLPTYTDRAGKKKLDRAYYMKNPNNRTELYFGCITNRFAVFTGNAIKDVPLRECTDALLVTLDRDMRRKEGKKAVTCSAGSGPPAESCEAVKPVKLKHSADTINKIIASLERQVNADKFRKLYYDGDFSDYGSQSEADCALCAIIAFRTGPDPELIDQIFRTSALFREKWEREDYRTATIAQGIEACRGTFHRSVMEHPPFIRFNDMTGEPYVVAPLLAQYTRDHLKYLLVRDNGKQCLLKYVYEQDGVYKLYADDMFKGCIKRYVEDYDPELVKMNTINEAYQQIITDLDYVPQDELNANETLINFKNCLLRVEANSLTMIPHTPSVYSTVQIPCDWTGKPQPTPVFDAYLKTLTNNDKDIAWLLLEVIGLILSNIRAWRTKKSLFMVGPGDSGKSVLKALVERLIGKGNSIGIDLREIEARFGTGAIYGTRLAGSSDMSFLTVDELKTFKKITGGDSLFAEFKGEQAFEYTYTGFLWFCMNRLPKFGGDDGDWVYNRIMVVNCPNIIPREKQDTQLIDKLYAEREGIIYKAVKALQRVIANGYRFTEPFSVTVARQTYQSENSTVISFFDECMCKRPEGKMDACTTGRVYKVYKAWCEDNNHGFAKTSKEFRDQLAAHLGTACTEMIVRRNQGSFYKDYTLTPEAKKQYEREYGYDLLVD